MSEYTTEKVNLLIKEYEKLKDEQRTRIDFRDRMTFITLGAIGGVFSFVFEKPEYLTALLALPFVCIILGWTYLTNDIIISEIGRYLRTVLFQKMEQLNSDEIKLTPNWEEFHKATKGRKQRKFIQLLVDLMIFCGSAIFSLVAFFILNTSYANYHVYIAIFEGCGILCIGYQFFFNSRKEHFTKAPAPPAVPDTTANSRETKNT